MPGKLTYFGIAVRAEPIRMLLSLTNTEFEDHRIQMSEWGPMKAAGFSEFGGLPVWEEDGRKVGQTNAILFMLGRRLNRHSSDEVVAANIDQLCMFIEDVIEKYGKYILPKAIMGGELGDEEMFLEGYWTAVLRIIEARLAASGKPFVAGSDDWTVADLKVFAQYSTTFPDCNSGTIIPEEVQAKVQAKIDAHPLYKAWVGRMKELTAAYIASRPVAPF